MSDRRPAEQNTNPPAGQGNRGKAPAANCMEPHDANYYPLRKNSDPQHKDSAGYAPVTLAPSEVQSGPTLSPLGIASEPAAQTFAGEGGYGYTGYTQQPSSFPAWEPRVDSIPPIPAPAAEEPTYTFTAAAGAPTPGGPSKPLEQLSQTNRRIAVDCFNSAFKRQTQNPERLKQFATSIGLPDTSTDEQLLQNRLVWLQGEIDQRTVISVEKTIDAWEWATFQTESKTALIRRRRATSAGIWYH